MIRSKAPLRLGLAGGGTDVSPFSDVHGGSVLNATINLYAYSFLERLPGKNYVEFHAKDLGISDGFDLDESIDIDGPLKLHRAVYKRIMDDFNNGEYIPLRMITYSDAPPGSGLGSSSTLVVAMIEAYKTMLNLPFGEYDIAHLAFEIERIDCGLTGGKQDQYAASFGGFNFIEFLSDDRVIVNPLRIKKSVINELESSIILFFTGVSRDSDKIIDDQIKSLSNSTDKPLDAMKRIKESSYRMKELLLKGDVVGMAEELRVSWLAKKNTSSSISNQLIDDIENSVLDAGARSIKVSGAGGGGFVMIFVKPEDKLDIVNVLSRFLGQVRDFQFSKEGSSSWTI